MLDRRWLLQASLVLSALPFRPARGDSSTGFGAYPDPVFDVTTTIVAGRSQGPRIESEQMGRTLVVHNYGHGNSAWSLSWGAAIHAVRETMARSPRRIAVAGAGVIGLTSALMAQRTGATVTLYARALLPQTSSARDLGLWRPQTAHPLGAEMARRSLAMHREFANHPARPVEWRDHYILPDKPLAARRTRMLQFNIADYSHLLLADFFSAGGVFVRRQFRAPSELQDLKEEVVIDCLGYGARALWNDRSLSPCTSRIAWLTRQPDLRYGFTRRGLCVLSRRDVLAADITGASDGRHARHALDAVLALCRSPIRPLAASSA